MPMVRMKCATSLRYARRVRALLRLASQISSSGMPASWSTLMRPTAPRLDGTMAFMFRSVLFFLAILVGDLIRDNPVYHVLILARLRHAATGVMHTSHTHIKKPATGFVCGRLLRKA